MVRGLRGPIVQAAPTAPQRRRAACVPTARRAGPAVDFGRRLNLCEPSDTVGRRHDVHIPDAAVPDLRGSSHDDAEKQIFGSGASARRQRLALEDAVGSRAGSSKSSRS